MSFLCYYSLHGDFVVCDPEKVQNCDINNMWQPIPHVQLDLSRTLIT